MQQCHGIELLRIVYVVSLQILLNVMLQVWTFFIALNCFTHQGMFYLDVCSRVNIESSIQNFHLLAIPLFDRHTTANFFVVLEKFLDVLFPNWRNVSLESSLMVTHELSNLRAIDSH